MSATSRQRGWSIVYDRGSWVYSDTREPIAAERPCARCGEMPTAEGYDACLGHVPGVVSACCGHGVEAATVVREEGKRNRISIDEQALRIVIADLEDFVGSPTNPAGRAKGRMALRTLKDHLPEALDAEEE